MYVACMGKFRNTYTFVVRKPDSEGGYLEIYTHEYIGK
jgi:hypothetical protein